MHTPTATTDRHRELAPLYQAGVVAILRVADATRLPAIAERLYAGGLRHIEVTMTTPGAIDAIRDIRARLAPDAHLGVGTVCSVADAARALDAGADFLVSPAVDEQTIGWCAERGMPLIAGALTPTEIVHAAGAGAAAVKVFPVGPVGGVAYLTALRGPLPNLALVPTGGVAIDDVGAFLSAGAFAVGIGGPLIGDAAADGGDLQALERRARTAIEQAVSVRGSVGG